MSQFFDYRGSDLHCEGVSLATIADEVGTPTYVYSKGEIDRAYRAFDNALSGVDHLICYSVKANSGLGVLSVLARLGAGAHGERDLAPRVEPPPGLPAEAFRREGDTWWLAFAGRGVRLRDLKGLRYLSRLLAEPGREFHVLDLVALEAERPGPADAASVGDSGPLLDARAKEAYRRRLTEIEEDLAEATSRADLGRIAQAQAEREFLEALRLEPDNADIHYQFGLYYKVMRQRARALGEMQTAVRLNPRHRAAREELEALSPRDSALKSLKKLFR